MKQDASFQEQQIYELVPKTKEMNTPGKWVYDEKTDPNRIYLFSLVASMLPTLRVKHPKFSVQ